VTESGKNPNVTEALREEILEDARRKARRTLERAKKQADRTEKRANEEAESAHKRVIDEATARADRFRRNTLASVETEIKREQLRARQRVVDEVYEAALERLRNLPDDRSTSVLRELIVEGVLEMEGEAFRVHVAPGQQDLLTDELLSQAADEVQRRSSRRVRLSRDGRTGATAASGGAVIVSADGKQMVDNTFEGRLRRIRSELRLVVAGVLFAKGGSADD